MTTCPSDKRWYAAAETPDGPTVDVFGFCKKYDMAMVVPIYNVHGGHPTQLGGGLGRRWTTVGCRNHIPQTSGF